MFIEYNKEDDNTIKKQSDRCLCMNYDIVTDKSTNKQYYVLPKNKRRCANKSEPGKLFCNKHKNCASFLRKYTSGYEPKYEPLAWQHPYVEGSHNCYSYFLNDKLDSVKEKCHELCLKKHKTGCPKKVEACGDLKPQPGNHNLLLKDGNLKNKKRVYKCGEMEKKILSDNPSLYKAGLTEKCKKQHYKGAMVIDPNHTFHFYRQDSSGRWSHKPGTLAISDIDADKKHIYVPHYANRDYSKDRKNDEPINYTDFCGYYCVPINKYLDTHSL
jgi:hypothetical protein